MGKHESRTPWVIELLIALVLIRMGVALRLECVVWPNFSPVASIALLSGLLFSHRWLAPLVPVGIMLWSDQWLGHYEFPVMCSVYACLTFPMLIGWWAQRQWHVRSNRMQSAWRFLALGCGSGLVSSVVFFLVTNATYWFCFARSSQSLLANYVEALPFFRYTLAGDLFFGIAFMGCFAVLHQTATLIRGELASAGERAAAETVSSER